MIVGYKVLQQRQALMQLQEAQQIPVPQQQNVQQMVLVPQVSPIVQVQPVVTKVPFGIQLQTQAQKTEQEQKEEERAKIAKGVKGFEIPAFKLTKVHEKVEKEKGARRTITYSLIPRNPAKGEPLLAVARIHWDDKLGKYIYELDEPKLSENMKELMVKVKEFIEDRLDVDFSKLKLGEAGDFLDKQVEEILRYYKAILTPEEITALKYYIQRDFIGLEKIEPLMRDEQIEDISCDGIGIPIYVFHRNQDVGSVPTNIVFNTAEELDSFITRLSQVAGRSISIAEPLVDGTLPDGSRLQATLATDIARKGSNFTIRKFSEDPLTPIHLLNYGTVDVRSLAYLWMLVDYGRSILVSGGTASGKTTFLNVLSLFIRPDKKIISIEDTAELRLPHPHWVPTVARTPIAEQGKIGQIDMFELLRESFRQRPDYLIVGEVRGQEAYILFQEMATGHPSLATIHAENVDRLVDRLTTPPISLPKGLVAGLDSIVFMARMRYREKFVRKVVEIDEVIRFDADSNKPVINTLFKWNPVSDTFDVENESVILKKISDLTGISQEDLTDEFERRMLVLNWLQEKGVTNFKDVYSVLDMYYYYPNRVVSAIEGEV